MCVYIYSYSRWNVRNYVRIVGQGGGHSKKVYNLFVGWTCGTCWEVAWKCWQNMCSTRLGKCWEVCDTWKTGWRKGRKGRKLSEKPRSSLQKQGGKNSTGLIQQGRTCQQGFVHCFQNMRAKNLWWRGTPLKTYPAHYSWFFRVFISQHGGHVSTTNLFWMIPDQNFAMVGNFFKLGIVVPFCWPYLGFVTNSKNTSNSTMLARWPNILSCHCWNCGRYLANSVLLISWMRIELRGSRVFM